MIKNSEGMIMSSEVLNSEGHKDLIGKVLDESIFWGDNPNVLFQSFELFPTAKMSFHEQINALTRGILVASLVLSTITQKIRFLAIGSLTIFLIWVFVVSKKMKQEGFSLDGSPYRSLLEDISGDYVNGENDEYVFDTPKSGNPFSNVLVTDYMDNPEKKPAPPIDEQRISDNILKKAKLMVQRAHPDFPDLGEKLFSHLGDEYQFEQSMQPFYSNSATTIPNDQKAFSDFCYGDMISCKEGNMFACARNLPRYGEGS